MLTRKIGSIIRGKSTPFQIVLGAVLGSMLGFIPILDHSWVLPILLILLLIIINANLLVAAFATFICEILSLLLVPLSFELGRLLLDGPTQPLFTALINAPVFALCGLEYYVTSGALLLGLITGVLLGLIFNSLVSRVRRTFAGLEESSDKYKAWTAKKWVKVITFIFVGGNKGKKSWAELTQKKIGNPIRPLGVVFAVLVVGLAYVVQLYFSEPFITAALRNGLQRANGATVDLQSAEIDLAEGRMTITALAMADPNALDTDLLRVAKLEADVSATDLLRKRLKLDRVVLSDASHGEKRNKPGRIVGSPPKPIPPKDPPRPGEKTIEDYIAEAEKWKERLAQIRQWLEKLSGAPAQPGEKEETLKERLERQVRESGYLAVRADHLIQGAPTFAVDELIAEKVRAPILEGETFDILAHHLSTHPHLVERPPHVEIKSSKQTFETDVVLASAAAKPAPSTLKFALRNLPADTIGSALAVKGDKPISGGTLSVTLDGTLSTAAGLSIDMPLNIALNNTTITVPGLGSAPVEKFSLPLGLRGPLDSPRITLDDAQLAEALKQAGAAALAGKVQAEAEKAISKATDKAKEKIDEAIKDKLKDKLPVEIPGVKNPLDSILGNKKDQK